MKREGWQRVVESQWSPHCSQLDPQLATRRVGPPLPALSPESRRHVGAAPAAASRGGRTECSQYGGVIRGVESVERTPVTRFQ